MIYPEPPTPNQLKTSHKASSQEIFIPEIISKIPADILSYCTNMASLYIRKHNEIAIENNLSCRIELQTTDPIPNLEKEAYESLPSPRSPGFKQNNDFALLLKSYQSTSRDEASRTQPNHYIPNENPIQRTKSMIEIDGELKIILNRIRQFFSQDFPQEEKENFIFLEPDFTPDVYNLNWHLGNAVFGKDWKPKAMALISIPSFSLVVAFIGTWLYYFSTFHFIPPAFTISLMIALPALFPLYFNINYKLFLLLIKEIRFWLFEWWLAIGIISIKLRNVIYLSSGILT